MRLIDADKLIQEMHRIATETNSESIHIDCLVDEAVGNAPTVDAVLLPCKVGDDVYIIPIKVNFDLNILSGLEKNNRVYHQKVAEIVFTQDCWYAIGNADKEYGTGRVLPNIFYKKTWFLTREEAEAALAKMKGGNDDA